MTAGIVLRVLSFMIFLGGAAPAFAETVATEQVFAAAKPRLLQIRSLLADTGQQTTLGSGFLVSADGLAITNYHVVSNWVLAPSTYRLEYVGPTNDHGGLTLLAFDLANDLALVRLDKVADQSFFTFDPRAVADSLEKGTRIWSLGNPLDLGFTIVEGTFNGPVDHSYTQRIHFTGAINAGMSGGPAITAEGRVAGVNVARRLDGQLVSFLVPARFAADLVAQGSAAPPVKDFKAEIGRQLTIWQDGLFTALQTAGYRAETAGPYRAPENAAPWLTCWSETNDTQQPKPRARVETTQCQGQTSLYIAPDLATGSVSFSHSLLRTQGLNALQFSNFLSYHATPAAPGIWSRKWHTPQECESGFITPPNRTGPPLRVAWCARAYRDFTGLYDFSVAAVTEDSAAEALVSKMTLQAVSFAHATALTQQFLAMIGRAP